MNQQTLPLVSICVPVYGVEKWIERCARSLFEQTYENLEFIFVNDCTPDRSIEILERVLEDYPARKPQTRILSHEKNRGLSAARITAIEAVRGEFLIHVDSDDYLALDAVEKLVGEQQKANADLIIGDYISIKQTGNKYEKRFDTKTKREYLEGLVAFNEVQYIWGILIKTSLQRENKLYPEEGVNLGEDSQVMPLLLYYSKHCAKCLHALYFYNQTNENSITYALLSPTNIWQKFTSIDILRERCNQIGDIDLSTLIETYEIDFIVTYFDIIRKMSSDEKFNFVVSRYWSLSSILKEKDISHVDDPSLTHILKISNQTLVSWLYGMLRKKRDIFYHIKSFIHKIIQKKP